MAPSKEARAKHARNLTNQLIPNILRGNPRARRGVDGAKAFIDPPPHPQQTDKSATIKVSLRVTDTLTAARALSLASPSRIAILNMASPLRPGGGVLSGASSQEEFLCARTTLYPSLRESFYRLPDVGGVYTPDVLVLCGSDAEASALPKSEHFFVDVVTAAALRFPDLDEAGTGYAEEKDREMAARKMRAVLRVCRERGASRLVLGAWGCGAYANPVGEVARAWKRVILGTERKAGEGWDGLEIVFAVLDGKMAVEFARHFGEELKVEGVGGE
jgi:uncharacterized protein (TIGR02452 family)